MNEDHKKTIVGFKVINLFLVVVVLFLAAHFALAVTPNPGHPWTEVGDGTFQVTGPSVLRTYTLPDANATILTSSAAVTVAQGGTGAATLTGILKGNGTSAVTAVTAPSGALVGDTDTQTLTGKTISKASNTLTGVAGSGSNSDITALSGLLTPLSVAQGGTSLATLTLNNVILGNGTAAPTFVAPGSTGNILSSNGTTWISAPADDPVLFTSAGLSTVNLTTTTALASATTHFQYLGVAPKAYTTCTMIQNVTTAAVTITYAEVAIFKGTPVLNGNASLTRVGFTNVAATYNSAGRKSTAITVTVAAGDVLWAVYGSQATTPFQVRGMLSDDLQSGVFQTGTTRPSTATSPFTTTLASAVAVPGLLIVKCV